MLIILPYFRSIMWSSTALVQFTIPQKLMFTSFSNSDLGFSINSRSKVQPTLFTNTSIFLNSSSALLTIAVTESKLVTSVLIATALPPRAAASLATFCPWASSISAIMILDFSLAKAKTIARPMFEPPPVTITALPARFKSTYQASDFLKHGSCTDCRFPPLSLLQLASSDQVALRHPEYTIYRCFLPDLTGFIALRHARPSPQRHFTTAVPKDKNLESEFNPAIADLGYRAPLVPRLARPNHILLWSFELAV